MHCYDIKICVELYILKVLIWIANIMHFNVICVWFYAFQSYVTNMIANLSLIHIIIKFVHNQQNSSSNHCSDVILPHFPCPELAKIIAFYYWILALVICTYSYGRISAIHISHSFCCNYSSSLICLNNGNFIS